MRSSKNTWLQRWGDEAVAGATICALGCNGPELFTNLISLYTGSDAGIGVVVGSEIFNLLIIVGAAVMCAPILPLKVEKAPFTRDSLFYLLSIVLLFVFLADKTITFQEASILLVAAVVYVLCVYFTEDVVNKMGMAETGPAAAGVAKRTGKMHGVEVEVKEILHSRMADGRKGGSASWDIDPTEHGIYAKDPNEEKAEPNARGSIGFQFAEADSMLGPILKYKDLTEVVVIGEGVIQLEFRKGFTRITLQLVCPDANSRDDLLKKIEKFSYGKPYIHGYDATVASAFKSFAHEIQHGSIGQKIGAIPELLIDIPLKATLFAVDVKDIKKESRWPACFLGAMVWLALFSFAMLEVAEQIHCNINALPNSFLGITVCAIGTSFPNAVASIIMAQQNKPAAAIANALGSNVQNVFLAMALPWVIFMVQEGKTDIPQNVVGINEGVVWMLFTLMLVVFFVLLPQVCTLNKIHGYILVAVYMVYLGLTCAETFKVIAPIIN
jgi:Ca2+/Na+ antiporter